MFTTHYHLHTLMMQCHRTAANQNANTKSLHVLVAIETQYGTIIYADEHQICECSMRMEIEALSYCRRTASQLADELCCDHGRHPDV